MVVLPDQAVDDVVELEPNAGLTRQQLAAFGIDLLGGLPGVGVDGLHD